MKDLSGFQIIIAASGVLICFLPLIFQPPAGRNRFGGPAERVGMIGAITNACVNYFNFSGRASRSEYWWFQLFILIAAFICSLIDRYLLSGGIWLTIGLILLVLPNWALTARRFHDLNRSGWWILLSLTGLGSLIVFFWMMRGPRGDATR